MSQRKRTVWAGILATSLIAVALIFVPGLLRGHDARRLSPPGKLVVHEWGTFTSFAGSDGVNLEFRPLVTNDLPRFIRQALPFPLYTGKQDTVALHRMETPVTYFYTDVPRVVNVRVDFPQGMLTEWYPIVKKYQTGQPTAKQAQGGAYLDWGAVRLTPPERFGEIRLRDRKGRAVPASLPPVAADDHYGRARETDSAIVETVDWTRGSHFEKFLFYRGLGNFELPIKLTALGGDRFEVVNASNEASGALLLVHIDDGRVRFVQHAAIKPHAAIELELSSKASTVDKLAEAMVHALTAAGLYEKESLAMVNTWRGSWFGENGMRLLYLVPGKLTDELLPLTIEPAPDECVRVLVGRLETLTPEDCQRLVRVLTGSNTGQKPTAEAIKAELASLGRFAEPAIQFVIGQMGDSEVNDARTSDAATRERLKTILAELRGGKK